MEVCELRGHHFLGAANHQQHKYRLLYNSGADRHHSFTANQKSNNSKNYATLQQVHASIAKNKRKLSRHT